MKKILLFLFAFFVFNRAQSQTSQGSIMTFDFSTAVGNESIYATNSNNSTYVNPSTITKGPGLQAPANATTGGNFLTSGYFVSTNWISASETNSITNSQYYQFTITPKPGYEFRVDTIVLRWRSATSGVTNLSVRTSQNNYTIVRGTGTVSAASSGTLNLVLTSPVASDSAITFRIYGWGASQGKNFGYGQNPVNATQPDIDVRGRMTTANIPTAVLSNASSGPSTICLGAGAFIKVTILGGTPPFTVWTTDNAGLKRQFTQNGTDDSIQVFPQSTKTYTLDSVKDVMGDKATNISGSATVTVTNSPVISDTGFYSRTLSHNDGLSLTYANGSICKSWVRISDSAGGTNPGSTTCSANVTNTSYINGTSRYFMARKVNITPTTNGVATVTIFCSQSDFDKFNLATSYQRRFPTGPNNTDSIMDKIRVFRTQSSIESDSLTTFIPNSIVWNSTNSQWEISFRVNDGILRGDYYITTPFNSSKMVTTITHTATTPQPGQTSAQVLVDWDSVAGVTQYRMRFRPLGGVWNPSTITGSQRLMSYLAFNTTYEVQVRVYESQSIQGEYTKTYTFTTPQNPGALPTCNYPVNIVKTVTPTSVTLSWDSVGYATSYFIQSRVKGTLGWGGTSTTGRTITFNSLTPNTDYEFIIRTTCQTGYTSTQLGQFSPIDSFKTDQFLPCSKVTGLSTLSIGIDSVRFKWNRVNYSTSYLVQMRVKGTTTWGGTSTADTNITFKNLSANTQYEWRVRASCNPNASTTNGVFSDSSEFTTLQQTLVSCLPPTNIVATPTTNSVTYTWNPAQFGVSYFVQMKPSQSLTWGGTTTSLTTITFGNLTPGTSYDFRIRTNPCEPGKTFTNTSSFSIVGTFTTLSTASRSINEGDFINLYPNPTDGIITIKSSSDDIEVSVYDVSGRLLKTATTKVIDIINFNTGTYIFKIRSGDTYYIRKINKK